MTTRHSLTMLCLALVLGGCEDPTELDDLPELADGDEDEDTGEQPVLPVISAATVKARCDAIKSVAAARGITNPLVIAGVANHETHLVQCLSEWPIHCAGPHSSDCGGPVLAGSGDGPCPNQQGGLGMFQFDAGTYAQTLAHYGNEVLSVAGNVDAGIEVIIHKVRVCQHTKHIATSDQAAIELINRARPGSPEYEAYISSMASCYNGCQPHYATCSHQGMRNNYKAGVQDLLDELGEDYWNEVDDGAPAPSSSARIGTHVDGRLEVFALGTDGAIVHRWQPEPNHAFVGWSSLGGMLASAPVVAASADGRLEIFAIGADAAVHHRWQEGGGHWNDGWESLGTVDTGFQGEPFVAANDDGRLEVFARTSDGRLWSKWQAVASAPFVADWFPIGTDAASDPVVATNRDGRLEMFVRGADGSLRHSWQVEPSGTWSGWNGLGGALAGDPAIGTNADGRLEVFHIGVDGALRHRWQLEGAGWAAEWASHGGGAFVGTPVVGSNLDGRMEIIARTSDGRLWHTWQTEANAPFADGWTQLGDDAASDPQVGRNADGRLEVFVHGGDGRLWHTWQVGPNGTWEAWEPFDGAIAAF
jgi:hypothetical protein